MADEPETTSPPAVPPLAVPASSADPEQRVRNAHFVAHRMAAQATQYTFQNAVEIVALTDLLIAKGVVSAREVSERRALAERQILAAREQEYAGPTLYPTRPEQAPREPTIIDCDARYSECRAGCCILYNVYLTAEEVRSGKYRWDLEHPYRLERTALGHCTYLDGATLKCTIWADRPQVCRGYGCGGDKHIWVDFEKRIGTGACKPRQAAPVRSLAPPPVAEPPRSD